MRHELSLLHACLSSFLPMLYRMRNKTFQLHNFSETNFYELPKRVLSQGNRVFRMGNVALRQEISPVNISEFLARGDRSAACIPP
jgi:hypothetical protein